MRDVRKTLAAQAGLLTELLTHATAPVLQDRGLSFSTFELLSAVKAAGTGASQAAIARRLGITPPTLTEAVRIAIQKGLLTQDKGLSDNRTKSLALTPHGEAIVAEVLRTVNQAEKAMVEGIEVESLRITIETLRTANRNLARAQQGKKGNVK